MPFARDPKRAGTTAPVAACLAAALFAGACDPAVSEPSPAPEQVVAGLNLRRVAAERREAPRPAVDPVRISHGGRSLDANRGELIVRFADGVAHGRRQAVLATLKGKVAHETRHATTVLVRLADDQDLERALALAERLPEVAQARPNAILSATALPRVPRRAPKGDRDSATAAPDRDAVSLAKLVRAAAKDKAKANDPELPAPAPPPVDPEYAAARATPWRSTGALAAPAPATGPAAAPYFPAAWYLQRSFAEAAWAASPGLGADVRVAVLDSGVSPTPSLPAARLAPGADLLDLDGDPADDNGHGTHMATLIAGADPVPGLAPAATIVPVRVLDADLLGTEYALIAALHWVAEAGDVDIANMSLAFPADYYPSPLLLEAIDAAHAAGVLLVAASGNDGLPQVAFPARCPEVLAVGAARMVARPQGDLVFAPAPYGNYGAALDLLAFGGDVQADADADGVPDGLLGERPATAHGPAGVYLTAGTSPAAALVSGAAALLLDAGAPPAQLRRLLQATTQPLDGDARAFTPTAGMGLLNAGHAADALERAYADGIAPPPPRYFVATAVVLERQSEGNTKTAATAFVELSDATGAPLGGVPVFGHLDGATREELAATADDAGHAALSGATFLADDASFFAFSVDAVIEPATGLPIRPHGLAHVDVLSFSLLANLGQGLGARAVALSYTPEALATLPGVHLDRVAPAYTVQSFGTGLISSALVFVASPTYFAQSGLYRSALTFESRGTGLISSAIVLSEALFAPSWRTLLGSDQLAVRNVTAGSGLISSAILWRAAPYALADFLVGPEAEPGVLATFTGAGLISSALVFNRAILAPDLSRTYSQLAAEAATASGAGLISSARLLDLDAATVASLGYPWATVSTRYATGAGLISSALIATFNPYGALAAYRPALATAVLTPIAGAGAATVPWGAAVETH